MGSGKIAEQEGSCKAGIDKRGKRRDRKGMGDWPNTTGQSCKSLKMRGEAGRRVVNKTWERSRKAQPLGECWGLEGGGGGGGHTSQAIARGSSQQAWGRS